MSELSDHDDRPRAIRVFISSTFRDMMAEREELVSRVFPAIRRLCESRGVTFSEVDLRWGVTDEQKAEGAVLPICLAEIERSRPWFIGLIGERYGWVPDEIPAELATRLGWLHEAAGKSVTELEILHGVLNDPDAAGYAFFYLRDPAWVAGLPESERAPFVDEDPSQHAKLLDLKARLRASSHPVRDYPDPVGLGAIVHADLTALVERLFPDAMPPDPLERDAATHAAHAGSRFADHVERAELRTQLDAFADREGPPLVVTGETGAGASALVANWARRRRLEHPDDVVIEHYVGATPAAADWRALAGRLVGELDRRHGLDELDVATLPDDVASRRGALAAAFARAAGTGRRTIVMIDGLDDLDDVDGAPELAWLPDVVAPAVRLVVTTDAGRPLEAAIARGFPVLQVPQLTAEERRTLTTTVLARYAKALGEGHMARVIGAPLAGNALFLRVLLDELRQHGDHFTLDAALDRLLAADDVDDLLEVVLERYERDYERDRPGLVGDAFRALWAARRGLAEAELLDVLGPGDAPLPHAAWSPLFLAAENGLVTRSGLFTFASDAHRKAVEDRYVPTDADKAAAHAVLARWFARQPLGPRVVDELPWQQLGAGAVDGLVASLANLEFLDAAYRRSLPDVRRLWAAAEAAGPRMGDAYADVVAAPASATTDQAWAVARLLSDAGYPAQALTLHRHLVDAARRDDNEPRLRAALVNLGAALWQQGELDGADPVLVEATDRCRAAGDRRALQAALGGLAMVRRDRGDLAGAVPLFEEAERLCTELGDEVALQASLGDHAQLLRQLGDRDGALALLVEQERLCRAAGDRVGTARALAGQATVLADRGEFARALELLRVHEATCRELGDLRGLAECLLNQAVDLTQLGDVAGSQTAAAEAETVARRLGDLGLLARILLSQASTAAGTGHWAEVQRLAKEAELSAREVNAPAQLALSLGLLGIARREQGDLAGSRAAHTEEEQVGRQLGDPGQVAVALSNLAAVDIAENRLADAVARMDLAEPVFRQQGTVTNLLPLLANRGQVHQHLGDATRAIHDLREGGALAVQLGNPALAVQLLTTAVQLLYGHGRSAEAEPVWADLATACRQTGDDAGLQRALGDQAVLVLGRGDLDAASALLDEQEAICRRTGDQVGLAACVGNRAIVLRQRGDLAGSLACLDEQLALARASGNGQGVLIATANRGDVLGAMGRREEGIAALTEARTMATQWGLTPMVAQLDQMIAALQAG